MVNIEVARAGLSTCADFRTDAFTYARGEFSVAEELTVVFDLFRLVVLLFYFGKHRADLVFLQP